MKPQSVEAGHVLPFSRNSTALLLDIDGTLLDFALTPGEVLVAPELLNTLEALHAGLNGAVAFVSGRRVADIDRIFSPLRLPAVGGHGAEFRSDIFAPDAAGPPPLPAAIKRKFAAISKRTPGVLIEDKGYALALHYRLAPDMGPTVIEAVERILEHLPPGIVEEMRGKFVVEVKPTGFTKASGVRAMMKQPAFAGRRPIFIGDDITDQTVFPIIPEYRGFSFSVGGPLARTDGYFDDPHSVRSWLARAAATLTCSAEQD